MAEPVGSSPSLARERGGRRRHRVVEVQSGRTAVIHRSDSIFHILVIGIMKVFWVVISKLLGLSYQGYSGGCEYENLLGLSRVMRDTLTVSTRETSNQNSPCFLLSGLLSGLLSSF